MTSVTVQAIAAVSRQAAEALRSNGFRRKAPHLWRQAEGLFHGIHFQGSHWGSADEGQFTINLVVTSPGIYRAWTGRPLPRNPATADFPVQERIGWLCPDRADHWWTVSSDTDLGRLGDDVTSHLITFALPFFARFQSLTALLASVRQGYCPGCVGEQIRIVEALTAHELGLEEEAADLLDALLEEAGDHPFGETVRDVIRRLQKT